jgi:hypothetical protein
MASPPLLENELTRRVTNAISDADIGQLQLSGAGQALIRRSAAGPGLIRAGGGSLLWLARPEPPRIVGR